MTAASASVWLLDLGNTRLKLCPHLLGSEVRKGSVQALAHADADFGSQLERALDALPPAGTALFASVGPPAVAATVLAQLAARGVVARAVGVDAQRPGLALCYAQPQRFGVDRWLGLIGARQNAGAGTPLLVMLAWRSETHGGQTGQVVSRPFFFENSLTPEIGFFYLPTGWHAFPKIRILDILPFAEPKCSLVVESHGAKVFVHLVHLQTEGFGHFQDIF